MNLSVIEKTTCIKCELDIHTAWIRNNWHLLGPLKQLSRVIGFPQEIIEIIANKIAPRYHTVTSSQKRYEFDEIVLCKMKQLICRRCLAIGIAHGLKLDSRLPYLRCHIGYFMSPINADILETDEFKNIIASELPEHYSCTYYRISQPICRNELPDLITTI